MSHLYELFSKQVARFCADSSRPDCNKNLLVTGLQNLASMDDNVLDKLDPYQRGAKEMSKEAFLIRLSTAEESCFFFLFMPKPNMQIKPKFWPRHTSRNFVIFCSQFGTPWWEEADSRRESATKVTSPTSQPELTC